MAIKFNTTEFCCNLSPLDANAKFVGQLCSVTRMGNFYRSMAILPTILSPSGHYIWKLHFIIKCKKIVLKREDCVVKLLRTDRKQGFNGLDLPRGSSLFEKVPWVSTHVSVWYYFFVTCQDGAKSFFVLREKWNSLKIEILFSQTSFLCNQTFTCHFTHSLPDPKIINGHILTKTKENRTSVLKNVLNKFLFSM